MEYSDKRVKKYELTKYTRELERYLNRIVSYIKKENLDKQKFSDYVDEIFKPFDGIKKVLLTSEYLKTLEQFVEYTANLPHSEYDMDMIQKDILHRANGLQKIKRVRNFTKDKHKGQKYE